MSKAQVNRLVRLIREGETSCADELYHLLERLIPSLNNSLKKSTAVLNSKGEDPHLLRTSVFLTEKTEALHQTVGFFLGGSGHNPSSERRAYFLAQIDFWDAKVNNLREDFRSFDDRARVWNNWNALEGRLVDDGWQLRKKVKERLKGNLRWRNRWRELRHGDLREPDQILDKLLKDWNRLIRAVAKILERDQRELFIECYTKE